jgi:hypothetical protein
VNGIGFSFARADWI